MSHSVTITRTTTTSTSAILVNTGYLKTFSGLLKLAQLLLGGACVGVVGYYMTKYYSYYGSQTPELFFLLISTAFLIGTFCLLTACICSISTASIISKTLYEVIYHSVACVLYLAAGLTLLIEVNNKRKYNSVTYEPYMAVSIIGLVLAALYLLSTILASRSYRGI